MCLSVFIENQSHNICSANTTELHFSCELSVELLTLNSVCGLVCDRLYQAVVWNKAGTRGQECMQPFSRCDGQHCCEAVHLTDQSQSSSVMFPAPAVSRPYAMKRNPEVPHKLKNNTHRCTLMVSVLTPAEHYCTRAHTPTLTLIIT